MTEDEAKTKLCCGPDGCGKPEYGTGNATNNFLQSVGNGASFPSSQLDQLRYSDAQPRLLRKSCLASECMAWRWKSAYQENKFSDTMPEGEDWNLTSPNAKIKSWYRTIPDFKHGYCGLAGNQIG